MFFFFVVIVVVVEDALTMTTGDAMSVRVMTMGGRVGKLSRTQ